MKEEQFDLRVSLGDFELLGSGTYEHCIEMARAIVPSCEIGHEGDCTDFADTTHIWANQEAKIEDEEFLNSCGAITRRKRLASPR